jgi:uncharacterized repeat protein (TIGR01451 family)
MLTIFTTFDKKSGHMKKTILSFLILFCLQLAPAKAQWVTIPDPSFVIWLQANYPTCMNGNLMDTTCSDIVNSTSLIIADPDIIDLTGIQYFDSATSIWSLLVFNLTNIPALPPALEELSIESGLLTSLPPLPNSLQRLIVPNNLLLSLPTLPASLEQLDCSNNQLTSIPNTPDTMHVFKIFNNNISCLVILPYVPNISLADISGTSLTCVPNQTSYSLNLPLCFDDSPINNPNNCMANFNITGKVYTDLNSNCDFDNSDLRIINMPVKLFDNQNNLLAMSNLVNGSYGFTSLQPDSFQVKIQDNVLPVSIACGLTNSVGVFLDSINQTIYNINFPVVCDTAYDIDIHSINSLGWIFPGQTHSLYTNVTNNQTWYNIDCGSSNNSGTVTLSLTGPVTFIAPTSSALTPTVSSNTFTYSVADFNNLTHSSFGLILKTDTTAQAGDQICVHVEINPTPLDADTTNNVYDFCYQVVNSYDPNMKEVYPVNVLPGYDDWFTYTIHFQNTGNAPAFNIRLRDTLDANLDINSFEVRGYSHPAQISINGNILTVRFNNIMLPDSTSDYEGSMGYFQYRLKPLPNLPNGTQIENTAYIYFDYNAPIVTNTTQNNFDMTVKTNDIKLDTEHFVLYPNPSTGLYMFKDNKNIKTVEVFNMIGELVLSQGNAKLINLQGFPKGIYVARVNGTQVCRLVKE